MTRIGFDTGLRVSNDVTLSMYIIIMQRVLYESPSGEKKLYSPNGRWDQLMYSK